MTQYWMLLLHLAGFSLWLAGLVAMACLLMAGARNKVAGILADAGATLILISGIYRAMQPGMMKQGWLHAKLALVAVLLVVHVLLRIKSKRGGGAGQGGGLLALSILLAVAILYLAVMRPF